MQACYTKGFVGIYAAGLAKAIAKCWGLDNLSRADLCWTAGLSILLKAKVGQLLSHTSLPLPTGPACHRPSLTAGIYAYVSLKDGEQPSEALKKEMVLTVRKEIGAFASPDVIHWAPGASIKALLLDMGLPQEFSMLYLTLHYSLNNRKRFCRPAKNAIRKNHAAGAPQDCH